MTAISKVWNQYKGMSAPLKASIWFTICNFLQRGISMITTPIFTRMFSAEEYGLFSTYASWENVAMMLVTLSLYKALMNLYVKYDDKDAVLSSVCGLELLITSIFCVLGILFQDNVSVLLKIPQPLVICLFVNCIFQSIFQCWSLHKRFSYSYVELVVVTLIMTLGSSLVGIICCIVINATAIVRAISNVIILSVVGVYLCYKIFSRNHSFIQKQIWKFALGFCITLLPHYLSEFVLQSSDKIMINYMCGPRDVAIYSIAYSVGSLIMLFTSAINSSFAAYQYQQIKTKNYELLSKRANQVLCFIGVILVCIMLFSPEIVLIFGGQKYKGSVELIIPICLGNYFNYMFQLFARVQEYYERKVTIVIPSVLCALLNIILNEIFIKKIGYRAAAYTTLFCYVLFCFVHFIFYRVVCKKILEGKSIYDIKGLIVISIGLVLISVIISLTNQIVWIKYAVLGFAIIIAVIHKDNIKLLFKQL